MSNVVSFPPGSSKTPTLKDKFGYADAAWLKMCAEWRAARAQQQKNWAEHQLATKWSTVPDKEVLAASGEAADGAARARAAWDRRDHSRLQERGHKS